MLGVCPPSVSFPIGCLAHKNNYFFTLVVHPWRLQSFGLERRATYFGLLKANTFLTPLGMPKFLDELSDTSCSFISTWKVLYVKQPTCDKKSSGVREYKLLMSYSWIFVDLRRLPILTHDAYYRTGEFQISLPIGPSSWYWPLISQRLLHSLLL